MIVYTPIDIKVKLPNYSEVLEYIKANYITNLEEHIGYTSWLCPIATPFPVTNWRDAKEVFPPNELEEFATLNFVPGILEKFPELAEIAKQLPYKTLYGMMFNLHLKTLPAHHDTLIDPTPPDLERYNLLISPHYGQSSFFLKKDLESNPVYPTILEEYPVYAFNDTKVFHGADPVLDNRIIIVFVGKLDKEKHSELVARSIEKFKEYIIEM